MVLDEDNNVFSGIPAKVANTFILTVTPAGVTLAILKGFYGIEL